jgi:hypothetical protein
MNVNIFVRRAQELFPELNFSASDPYGMKELAKKADPLADNLFSHFRPFSSFGSKGFPDILSLLAMSDEDCLPLLCEKTTLAAFLIDKEAFVEETNTIPTFIDIERLRNGQRIYHQFFNAIVLSTLYGGLIPGYASERMSNILLQTGYLADTSKILSRLVETGYWAIAVMKSFESLLPGGEGFNATIRVRCLHASVRKRIAERSSSLSKDEDKVCPITGQMENPANCPGQNSKDALINQADMVATILAFSALPMMYISSLSDLLSLEQMEDFLHAWRYVGFLMGISSENDILKDGMEGCLTYSYHYLKENIKVGNPASIKLTQAILDVLVKKSGKDIQYHSEMIRHFDYEELPNSPPVLSPSDPERHKAIVKNFKFHIKYVPLIMSYLLSSPIGFLIVYFQAAVIRLSAYRLGADVKFRPKEFAEHEKSQSGQKPKLGFYLMVLLGLGFALAQYAAYLG